MILPQIAPHVNGLAALSCDKVRRTYVSGGAFPQERKELPTNGAAEQLGAEAPVNGSRLPRGPAKQTLSG